MDGNDSGRIKTVSTRASEVTAKSINTTVKIVPVALEIHPPVKGLLFMNGREGARKRSRNRH
jgi:hypothetical protein